MTTRLDTWLLPVRITADSAGQRAASTWAWIQRKTSSVVFIRGGVPLAAQTVRVEYQATAAEINVVSGVGGKGQLMLFGIQGHDTLPDTDIKRGDKFRVSASGVANCEVISVNRTQTGQIQAVAEIIE